MTNVNSIFFQ